MAALDLFPVELLLQIFSLLRPSDLLAVCRTSSSLCSVAQPLLYSSIELTWKESHDPPIALLLSTLLRRPDLAAQVDKLKMDGDDFWGPDGWRTRQPPKVAIAREHLVDFTACIDTMHLPHPNRHNWVDALQEGTMDALVALVVSRLPNLSSLHLESGVVKESRILGDMLASALCGEPLQHGSNLPTFSRLQNVTFLPSLPGSSWRGWMMPGNTKDGLAFLYLPNLKHLHARLDNPPSLSWPAAAPACDNLTWIKLSGIREGPLGQLLRATKRLETLDWEWWYDPHGDYDADEEGRIQRISTPLVDLDQITADLGHVRTTLKSLCISVACGDDDNGVFPDLQIQGSLDGLRGFERLAHLEVPLVLLVGFARHGRDRLDACFPTGLESLVINDDGWLRTGFDWPDFIVLPLIGSWLARWRMWTPRLRMFTWLLKTTDDDSWGPMKRQELRDACDHAGVAVKIVRLVDDLPQVKERGY